MNCEKFVEMVRAIWHSFVVLHNVMAEEASFYIVDAKLV